MKKLLVIAALFLLWAGLSANVLIPRYIARVWFDDSDACHVMFGEEAWWEDFDVLDLSFTTSAGTFYLPDDYQQPEEPFFVINLNQEIPGFSIQRNEDFLDIDLPYHDFPESLRWGLQSDLNIDIRPLTPGQAAVQIRIPVYIGHGEYDSCIIWAKDNQPTNPESYEAIASYTLSVHLEDDGGVPAALFPVYSSIFGNAQANELHYVGTTDNSGNWSFANYAIRRSILVKDPRTGDSVIQELLFPEPEETIQLNGIVNPVSVNDPQQTPPIGKLNLYPSLFGPSTERSLTLNYESVIPLSQVASLRLYDLRGRYISSKEMPISGLTHWELPDLPSGIYFISLTQNDRILDRSRITIFK